jgi:hypothetical protein
MRVGNPVRVSESLSALTMDGKMRNHPAYKDIKKLKIQANEYKNMAHRYKKNFGKSERDQRKALFDEAHKTAGREGTSFSFALKNEKGTMHLSISIDQLKLKV